MTWRRLHHLVSYLPPDSAIVRTGMGEAGQWTIGEHLMASTVDALRVANWQRSAKKGSRPPKPMPRPGDAKPTVRTKAKRSFTPAELDAVLAKRREEVG